MDETSQIDGSDRHKLTLSVAGMTCSSCTRGVAEAIASVPGVHNIAVSLIDNFATCTLEGKEKVDTIRNAIDEHGYEAHVVSIELERPFMATGKSMSVRTVALKIDGILDSYVCHAHVVRYSL